MGVGKSGSVGVGVIVIVTVAVGVGIAVMSTTFLQDIPDSMKLSINTKIKR